MDTKRYRVTWYDTSQKTRRLNYKEARVMGVDKRIIDGFAAEGFERQKAEAPSFEEMLKEDSSTFNTFKFKYVTLPELIETQRKINGRI